MYISVDVLREKGACLSGIRVFKNLLGKRKRISADVLLREAIEGGVDLDYVSWGLNKFGSEIKDASRVDWDKLKGLNWNWLLINHPQLAKYKDWSKLSGFDWRYLLIYQPQFADKCDWNKLSGEDWCDLLRYQPQFADKCDWNKLDGSDWRYLLRYQPQFEKYRESIN